MNFPLVCYHRVRILESERTCGWIVKLFADLVSHPQWRSKMKTTGNNLAIWCGVWGELFMCCCEPLWYLGGRVFPAHSASSWICSRWITAWPSSTFCNIGPCSAALPQAKLRSSLLGVLPENMQRVSLCTSSLGFHQLQRRKKGLESCAVIWGNAPWQYESTWVAGRTALSFLSIGRWLLLLGS